MAEAEVRFPHQFCTNNVADGEEWESHFNIDLILIRKSYLPHLQENIFFTRKVLFLEVSSLS